MKIWKTTTSRKFSRNPNIGALNYFKFPKLYNIWGKENQDQKSVPDITESRFYRLKTIKKELPVALYLKNIKIRKRDVHSFDKWFNTQEAVIVMQRKHKSCSCLVNPVGQIQFSLWMKHKWCKYILNKREIYWISEEPFRVSNS